ncbi:hypothetical protein BD560DRAFT_320290, partial [Blakeslea trispora]
MCYQFVWQNKSPRASFDQLCLPRTEGGLGLLNPSIQALVLQMKWLRSLFSRESSSLKDMMLHHFALMSPCIEEPLFTFYSPDHRPHDLAHPISFVHSLYKAFNHFKIKFSFDKVPLLVILQWPLRRFFEDLPVDHWLHRRKTLPVSLYLDTTSGSLPLVTRRPGTYARHPYLLFRLYREVV